MYDRYEQKNHRDTLSKLSVSCVSTNIGNADHRVHALRISNHGSTSTPRTERNYATISQDVRDASSSTA